MRNFIQPRETMTLTAPVGGGVSGQGVQIGNLFVVAAGDADAGDPFDGQTCGVFTLPKTTGTAWTEGELLYWDATAGEVTTDDDNDHNRLIGWAAAAAGSSDATGSVRLDGTPRPFTPAS